MQPLSGRYGDERKAAANTARPPRNSTTGPSTSITSGRRSTCQRTDRGVRGRDAARAWAMTAWGPRQNGLLGAGPPTASRPVRCHHRFSGRCNRYAITPTVIKLTAVPKSACAVAAICLFRSEWFRARSSARSLWTIAPARRDAVETESAPATDGVVASQPLSRAPSPINQSVWAKRVHLRGRRWSWGRG